MTFDEFFEFFQFVFEEKILRENGDGGIGLLTQVILWRRSLLTALCSKMNEIGNFSDSLNDQQRHCIIEFYAKKYMYLILALTIGSEIGTNISKAWDAQNETNEKFGYKSGSIFEITKPHRVLRDL
jgi:hypothetical protein